jgi:hypothetical protein
MLWCGLTRPCFYSAFMSLWNNRLSGDIPSELSSLTQLGMFSSCGDCLFVSMLQARTHMLVLSALYSLASYVGSW